MTGGKKHQTNAIMGPRKEKAHAIIQLASHPSFPLSLSTGRVSSSQPTRDSSFAFRRVRDATDAIVYDVKCIYKKKTITGAQKRKHFPLFLLLLLRFPNRFLLFPPFEKRKTARGKWDMKYFSFRSYCLVKFFDGNVSIRNRATILVFFSAMDRGKKKQQVYKKKKEKKNVLF